MKSVLLLLLRFYQRFLTLFSFGSCRYYPTCSEYAKWQIEYDSVLHAIWRVTLRILRCNQLFKGGIDYPVIRARRVPKIRFLCLQRGVKIAVWFVPSQNGKFFVVKSLDAAKITI